MQNAQLACVSVRELPQNVSSNLLFLRRKFFDQIPDVLFEDLVNFSGQFTISAEKKKPP